jgi:Lipopolysaccharide kinase (Kdo/WaaP) family
VQPRNLETNKRTVLVNSYESNANPVLAGGIQWWLPSEQTTRLLGPNGLRLEEWLRSGQARIVKQGHHRIVYRVELPGLIFYLKHNLLPDMRSWVRQLVRPSKARMEFSRAVAVAKRGLPTVSPLALGEKQAFLGVGESFIITHSIENSQSLHAFLTSIHKYPTRRLTRIRQRLAKELGTLLARIHQAGIMHQDLHCGNILLRECAAAAVMPACLCGEAAHARVDGPHFTPAGADGGQVCQAHDEHLSLFLIDLNGVRIGAPLGWKRSLENLAMLNRWFVFRATRTDRVRFWRAYQAGRQIDGQPLAQDPGAAKILARQVEEQTLASIQVLCGHFERRCLKANRYFHEINGPQTQGNCVSDLDRADWQRLEADPDEPFRRPGARLLKNSASSTVTEFEVRVGGKIRSVIYKRFKVTRWTDPLAALVRSSPARRSWVAGQALMHRSLPTPRPLLMIHRRRYGMEWEGYIMTEKIEGALTLSEFEASLPGMDPRLSRPLLRRRIEQVAHVMRELHRWQFANRDCKAANWLLSPSQESSDLQRNYGGVWMIDLVGIARQNKLSDEQRAKNIARLNASFLTSKVLTRTDRLRFLRVYMQWNLASKEGWKTWWRSIELATQAKVERNARSRRILT